MMDEIIPLISFSVCLSFVYWNGDNFYVLILYPAILLKMFFSCGVLWWCLTLCEEPYHLQINTLSLLPFQVVSTLSPLVLLVYTRLCTIFNKRKNSGHPCFVLILGEMFSTFLL